MEDVLELEQPEELEQEVSAEEPVEEQQGGENSKEETAVSDAPVTSLLSADGKKLDPVIRELLGKIKTDKPDAGKLLTKAVYRVAELDRQFPGGLTEVCELRDKVEQLGGVDGIQEKLNSLGELTSLSEQFMAADPAFVEDMVKSSPEAFAALAPVVLSKYSQTNPEAFGAYLGRIVYGDFQRNEVPLLMARFQDVIGDNPKALSLFADLNAYLGGFKTLADKPVTAAQPKAPAAQPKNEDITARAQEFSNESATPRNVLAKGEYQRLVGGRAVDAEDRAQIETLYLARSAKLADQYFPRWRTTAQGYIASGQKSAYLRLMASIDKRVVPEAVSYAVSRTVRTAAKVSPVARPGQPRAVTAKSPVATGGFKPVANEPSSWDIDYGSTTAGMLVKNQAVLKNGTKVSWR